MALETFTPARFPDQGTSNTPKIKLLKAEFGDGYTQAAPDGLNHIKRSIKLKWTKQTPTQANVILNFMTVKGGYRPFYYTPTDEGSALKWTCPTWSSSKTKGGLVDVSVTFEQSFTLEL